MENIDEEWLTGRLALFFWLRRGRLDGGDQGVTIEIGGDTTKLQTALKGVNTEVMIIVIRMKCIDIT